MDLKLLGEYVREMRIRKGYSLRELSDISGVSHSQISKLEKGVVKSPSDDTLERIAEALNVDKFDFFALAGRVYTEYTYKNLTETFGMIIEGIKEVAATYQSFTNPPETRISAEIENALLVLTEEALRYEEPPVTDNEIHDAAKSMRAALELWKKKRRFSVRN